MSQRPVRIQCADDVWARAKDEAIRRGVTVGEWVRLLVTAEARRLRRGGPPRDCTPDPGAPTRSLRIAVDVPDWIEIRSAADGVGGNVSRYTGLGVEAADRRAARQSSP